MQQTITVQIIGNGPGAFPSFYGKTIPVFFNRANHAVAPSGEIWIRNQKVAGAGPGTPRFSVAPNDAADAFGGKEALESRLEESADKLKLELGCEPSSGLATVATFTLSTLPVEVYRMPLRPSLLRPSDLDERKPLACAFHNWLGEQRIAWRMIRSEPQLRWESFTRRKRQEASLKNGESPYQLLLEWMEMAEKNGPDWQHQHPLRELVNNQRLNWTVHQDRESLLKLEKFFFLERKERQTKKWWLYSNDLSQVLDNLLEIQTNAQHSWYAKEAGG